MSDEKLRQIIGEQAYRQQFRDDQETVAQMIELAGQLRWEAERAGRHGIECYHGHVKPLADRLERLITGMWATPECLSDVAGLWAELAWLIRDAERQLPLEVDIPPIVIQGVATRLRSTATALQEQWRSPKHRAV